MRHIKDNIWLIPVVKKVNEFIDPFFLLQIYAVSDRSFLLPFPPVIYQVSCIIESRDSFGMVMLTSRLS